MSNPFLEAASGGEGGPPVKLEVGQTWAAEIVGYRTVTTTNLNTGDKEDVAIIEGVDADGVKATLWCQKLGILSAIGRAFQEVGHQGEPEVGGKIMLKREPDGEPSRPGYSAPHRFSAKYQRPKGATAFAAAAATAGDDGGEDPASFFDD